MRVSQAKSFTHALVAAAATLLLAGCAPHYYPPPPPAAYAPGPSLVQLAERNGFETGHADGVRALSLGAHYSPRHTRAFHDTPGYDPQLGPFPVYRDAFRNAYLRGYDRGYHRG